MHLFRLALRHWCQTPTLTLVAICSLAAGIGANAIVFTWIRATLLEALPGVSRPGELAVITTRHVSGSLGETLSLKDIESLSSAESVFAGITASQLGAVSLQTGEHTEWLWGQFTLANYFEVLGVRPVLGRGFLPGEDRSGTKDAVAVISYDYWQRRFQGDPGVVNRVVEFNHRPVTIVGVAPAGFLGTMGGLKFDVWVPLGTEADAADLRLREERRGWRWLHTVARLAPGVSHAQARTAADSLGRRLAQDFPAVSKDLTFTVLRVWEAPWGGQGLFLPLLRSLAVVALLLLGLVLVNVANLLLARALVRRAEMAVRVALGASRGRLLQQLLAEGLVLAVLGGLGGLAVGWLGARTLTWMMPPTYLPLGLDLSVDYRVVLAVTGLTLGAGLLLGLVPAWSAFRTDLHEALKSGGRTVSGDRRMPLKAALVIGEVALALTLLVAMGLCVRSFQEARQMNLGLQTEGVMAAGFRLSPRWGDDAAVRNYYRRLQAEVQRLPGVESAAYSDWLPLGFEGGDLSSVEIPGYLPQSGESMTAGVITISPGWFTTLRIPQVGGRDFRDEDGMDSERVVVVNEELARRWFPGQDPVGRQFQVWGQTRRIIGVVQTGKYRHLNEAPMPYLFLPAGQVVERDLTLVVKTSGDFAGFRAALERLAAELDSGVRPFAVMDYPTYAEAALAIPRVAASLMSVLGVVALLLAVLGLYGVMSQQVGQRTRELGVRLALGAQPGEVLRLILAQGFRLTLAGLMLGMLGGWAASRLLRGLLVGIGGADLWTWILVPLVLLAATTFACWWPAWRASRIDPLKALRHD